MSEILNERGRARAGEPRVRRAHSVRAGERVARTQHVGEADGRDVR